MIETILGDDVDSTGKYLPEVIYGANDGIVTTFAVVSGVAGAALDPSIVLVLGIANLLADGFSMGMSDFLSQRSERDYRATRNREAKSEVKVPWRTASVTFLAFVIVGWVPLTPYVLTLRPLFVSSIAFTGLTFFIVGASRSLVTDRRWYLNGGEMLIVGMAAATVAYVVGDLLGGLV